MTSDATVRIRSDGAPVHGSPSGRPRQTAAIPNYALKGYRRSNCDCNTYHEITCIAQRSVPGALGQAIGHDTVGSLNGYLVDLKYYRSATMLVLDMDSISQGTYDAAEYLQSLGTRFWRTRDLLLFIDTVTVEKSHRRHGLARALGKLALRTAGVPNRKVTVMLQPWPLEFDTVEPQEVKGQQIISDTEWEQEMSTLTNTWLKVFPFLKFSGMGGLAKDRSYYLGQVPQP